MTARGIVRDPAILGGRWRFADTTIAIADVLAQIPKSPTSIDTQAMEALRETGITDEDIQSAAQFPFPEVRELHLGTVFSSVIVECVCGEDTPKTGLGPGTMIVACACGRNWRVTIQAEPA